MKILCLAVLGTMTVVSAAHAASASKCMDENAKAAGLHDRPRFFVFLPLLLGRDAVNI